jgi:hypothetical protein
MAFFVQDATLFLLKHWHDDKVLEKVAEAEKFLVLEISSEKALRRFLKDLERVPLLTPQDFPRSELVDLLLQFERKLWAWDCVILAVAILTSCNDGKGEGSCLRLLRELLWHGHRRRDFSPGSLKEIFRNSVRQCLASVQFFPPSCVVENRNALEEACLKLGSHWDVRVGGCFAQMLPDKLRHDMRFIINFVSRVNDGGLSLQRRSENSCDVG